jgi:hypothetical protein
LPFAGITLPLIVCKNDDSYIIIDGCKRFQHIVEMGETSASCGVLNIPYDPLAIGMMRVLLNRGRNLHFREKLLFIGWLKKNVAAEEYKKQCKALGIDSERNELEKLVLCPSNLIDAVFEGYLDSTVAPEMIILSQSDQNSCLRFFNQLAFSRQMQREFIEWLPEIACRHKITVQDFLSSHEFINVCDNKKLNEPQKIRKIRDLLFEKRFPNLTAAKQAWNKLAQQNNPDTSRVHFQPSEAFEKNRLEIKVSITDSAQAAEIFKKLSLICDENWKKLINPC